MNRYERTKALVEGDSTIAREIAAEVEKACEVVVLDEPHEELVMVKVRESARNSLFYLSEALMCSCRVKIGEGMGFGYVLGSKRQLAYDLAVIDAAFSIKQDFDAAGSWQQRIEKEAKRLHEMQLEEDALTQRTRVAFSTMAGDA